MTSVCLHNFSTPKSFPKQKTLALQGELMVGTTLIY